MALLLANKTYIKFDADGTATFYKSKEARKRTKSTTSSKDIIAKYNEILTELNDDELLYYSPEDRKKFESWLTEAKEYKKNLAVYNINGHYPLMAQYFEDVDQSIPEIICEVRYLNLAEEANYSVKAIYAKAKEHEIFGKADEVEDC